MFVSCSAAGNPKSQRPFGLPHSAGNAAWALPRKSLRDSICRQRHRFGLSFVTRHFTSQITFLTGTA